MFPRLSFLLSALSVIICMTLGGIHRLAAQSTVWTGAQSNDWNLSGNWNQGTPGPSTNTFISTGTSILSGAGFYSTLQIGRGDTFAHIGTLQINGGSLNGGTAFLGVQAGSSGTAHVIVNNNGSWTINGNLAFSGQPPTNADATLTINGGNVAVQGTISYNNTNGAIITLNGGMLTAFSINGNSHAQSIFTFNGGTLGALAPGTILSNFPNGTVTITNNSTIQTFGNAITLSPSMSGVGGLTLIGTGAAVVTLTGNNTYSGPTVLSANTTLTQGAANTLSPNSDISIANGNTLNLGGFNGIIGSLSGVAGAIVTNNGAAATLSVGNTNHNGTFAGSLVNGTGSLALHKVGSGIQVLSGHNTYSGTTTLTAGTLSQGAANSFSPSSNVSIAGGATLDMGGFNGTIAALSGAVGSIITNNGATAATLTTSGGNGTFAGTLRNGASPLALNKIGATTLTLSGTNTYTGGTTVTSGTLIGNTFSLQGAIANNADLVFVQSGFVPIGPGSGIFNGTISGPGTVTINNSGGGIVRFNTSQPYTGATIIQAGDLQVNAQLGSSNVTVNPGGILSGPGPLAGNLINSGIVNAGASPGTLTVNGDYTQTASGTLIVELADFASFDQLVVGGFATLDGTLAIEFLDGFAPTFGDEFVLLTAAAGVDGQFSLVTEPRGSLLEVIYGLTEVVLLVIIGPSDLTPGSGTIPGGGGTLSGGAAGGGALRASGTHIAGIIGHPSGTLDRIGMLLDMLGIPFSELVPNMAATSKDVVFGAANIQYSELTTRLAAIRSGVTDVCLKGLSQEPMREQLAKHEKIYQPVVTSCEPWDIYAFASGIFSCMQNVSDLPKIKSQTGYFGAGGDYRVNEYVSLGTYVGYQGIWSRFEKNRLQSNGVKWGLYGTAFWEGFYFNAIAGGGANFLNMRRTIDLIDIAYRATSHPFVGELNSLLGGGYEYRWNNWIFGVNNSIQYTYARMTGFRESGADTLNVQVDRQNLSSLIYTLGGNISYLWELCENVKILPTVGLSWQHEFLNYEQEIWGAFNNGAGAAFPFYSRTGDRNFALGTAGITAQWGRWGAWAYWTTQFLGNQIYSNAVQVGLSYSF